MKWKSLLEDGRRNDGCRYGRSHWRLFLSYLSRFDFFFHLGRMRAFKVWIVLNCPVLDRFMCSFLPDALKAVTRRPCCRIAPMTMSTCADRGLWR